MVASYVSAFYEVYLEGHVNRQLVMIMLYVLGWYDSRKEGGKDKD